MQKKIIVFLIIALFLSTSFISISAKEIETKVKKPCPTLAKKWFIVTIKNQDGDLIQRRKSNSRIWRQKSVRAY